MQIVQAMDSRLTGRKTNPTPVVGQRNVLITSIRAENLQALPGVRQAASQLPSSNSTPLQLTSTVIDKTTLKVVSSDAVYKKTRLDLLFCARSILPKSFHVLISKALSKSSCSMMSFQVILMWAMFKEQV